MTPLLRIGLMLGGTLPMLASTVTFTDATFNLVDYSTTTYNPNSIGLAQSQISSGGNPGQAYQLVMTSGAGASFDVRQTLIDNTFAYNPSVQGAITALDVSIDRFADFGPLLDPLVPFIPGYMMLLQNGTYYQAFSGVPFTPQTYQTSLAYTTASDWEQINLAADITNSALHPDFTATGGNILFGFSVEENLIFTPLIVQRVDNVSFAINPIPEPATVGYVLGGLLALMAIRRRCA